jgi:GLPGLI family protein
MKQLFTALVAIAITLPSLAQNKFEGTVVFGLEYKDLPAEMAAMEAMLPDEMTTRIKGDKTRLEQSMGMGMSQVTITDMKTESGTLLMDMMGKKMAVSMSKGELDKLEKKKAETKPKFNYVKGGGKEIAGYKCEKVMVTMEGVGEMELFYTNELPAGANKQFEGLKGFPLEYTMDSGQFKVKMTAKLVTKEKLDKSLFEIPSDFEKMTFAEFEKAMGGMMGGG